MILKSVTGGSVGTYAVSSLVASEVVIMMVKYQSNVKIYHELLKFLNLLTVGIGKMKVVRYGHMRNKSHI
jgi:hypothetical protein